MKKFQLEFTMQKKIEVYDRDGRARGGTTSELPPELAAAIAKQRHSSFGASTREVGALCTAGTVKMY